MSGVRNLHEIPSSKVWEKLEGLTRLANDQAEAIEALKASHAEEIQTLKARLAALESRSTAKVVELSEEEKKVRALCVKFCEAKAESAAVMGSGGILKPNIAEFIRNREPDLADAFKKAWERTREWLVEEGYLQGVYGIGKDGQPTKKIESYELGERFAEDKGNDEGLEQRFEELSDD